MRTTLIASLALVSQYALFVHANSIPLTRRHNITNGGVADLKRITTQVERTVQKIHTGFDNFHINTGFAHPFAPPRRVLRRHHRRATNAAVPLTDQSNEQLWSGVVGFGTPPKQFVIDFDTGSSDIFLPSVNCTINCDGHVRYDTSKSSTAEDQNKNFTLTYGDGSNVVEGLIFNDVVSVGELTATNQSIGSALRYSTADAKDSFPPDGLIGMGFPALSAFNRPPFFQNLISQNQIESQVFGMALTLTNGELFLGGVNTQRMKGDATYVPVTAPGYWQIPLDSITYNKTTQISGNGSAIVDSGTTSLVGSSKAVEEAYKNFPGSQALQQNGGITLFSVPCNNTPSLSIQLGGKEFPIPSDAFSLGTVSANDTDNCVGGLIGIDSLPFDWILGDMFMRNIYTIFDVGNKKVGFAGLA